MRYIYENVQKDLQKKMVLIAGPRQCGKTTLALDILKAWAVNGKYFNWDRDRDRKALLKEDWNDSDGLLVFDEIHKFKRWKNWLKGLYDTEKNQHSILVTGSARLDVFRRGGDSLLGRYHLWHLHPFSLHEYAGGFSKSEALKRLMTLGGFPEPFMDGSDREARRWRRDRNERILKEDIRDLEPIRDIQTLSLLLDLLKTRVGGMVVMSNLAEDLQIAPMTVTKWIQALERMYIVFTVRPYTTKVARAIQKPPKIYFYDNGDVEGDEGARFENLVACHLRKKIQFLSDRDGDRYELQYIRDKEKREVDFVITKNKKILSLIEVKWSDRDPAKSLIHFAEKLQPLEAIQIVGTLENSFTKNKLSVQSALQSEWLVKIDGL